MRISCMTGCLASLYGEALAIQKLGQLGFDGIDFTMSAYPLDHEVYAMPLPQLRTRFARLRDVLEGSSMRACQMHAVYPTYVGEHIEDARRFDAAVRAIYACQALGCPYLVVHPMIPDATIGDTRQEEAFALNMDFYQRLLPTLQTCDIQVGIENMFSYDEAAQRYCANAVSYAHDMVVYIDTLNAIAGEERFVACLDTGHANIIGESPAHMIRCLGARLRLMHLHDNYADDDTHNAPFMGNVPWTDTLDALRETRYAGDISFETDKYLMRYPPALALDAANFLLSVGKHFQSLSEFIPASL